MNLFRKLAAVAVIGTVAMVFAGACEALGTPVSAALGSGLSPAADGKAAATTTPSGFTLRPGEATDVGVGANEWVWIIGANPVSGGFGVWHWTGTTWAPVPGGGRRIAVGPHGDPWMVNSYRHIYHWSSTGWALLPGDATDVGVGANGSAWVVGANSVPGGFGIWHWAGTAWAPVPGGGRRIAVGPHGDPWVVNSSGHIYHWSSTGWALLPGGATDVGVGANGSVWVIGTNSVPGGFGIWRWTGTTWAPVPGGAVGISVDAGGNAWVVNSSHKVWSYGPIGSSGGGGRCTSPYFSTSDPNGGVSNGGFYVHNDAWNTGVAGPQTLYVCSYHSWYAVSNQPNTIEVKTYPNVHKDYSSAPVNSFSSITSTFSEVGPHVGDYEYAYDMWVNGVASPGSNEVMIWTDNFGQTPAGSRFATVTFGGVTYNVYATPRNAYLAFVPTVNAASGSVDILSMLHWLTGQGRLSANSVIDQIGYGVEICSTAGGPVTFAVNGFSLTTS
jgi:hypothetical protein